MTITAILFDVGGVLITPLDPEALRRRREALAASLGFDSAEAMWRRFFEGDEWAAAKTGRMTHEQMWDQLLRPYGYETREAQAAIVEELYRGEGVDPGMAQLVAALHGDYRLAILSNWDDRLELLLEHYELSRYFDVIFNSHSIGMAKPDEETYRYVLEQLELSPSELLFIDDKERNTRVAERLGISSIVFRDVAGLVAELIERGILSQSYAARSSRST
ncbi:MAG: HAD family phosphatase [Chloroflexi bacterium]|nr:HAD family phosphatase [Chloroflexota bacterium]